MVLNVKVVGRMLTIGEVAQALHISERTAFRLLKRGEFPLTPVRVGAQYRFSPAQVEALVNGGTL